MFIALKPCRFAGQKFLSGETIPGELVHPDAVRRLKRQRILAEANEQNNVVAVRKTETVPMFTVPILAKEGTLPVELPAEDLEALFMVLQKSADNAAKIIKEQENKDLLLCIHALDNRKSVKDVAKERAEALIEAEKAAEA
ncbi:MAG: hypothetical protein IIV02_06050 [Peptococcaceae bacterium]|nr:hypothetical protein [Peptococcaceae bacterium]